MTKIYRASSEEEIFNEICYDCAKQKKEGGLHIQNELDNCSICGGDYFLDGRKKYETLHNTGCIC